MKNQTLSIERMRHLKDLGVGTSNASMRWINSKENVPMQCMEANKILSICYLKTFHVNMRVIH